MRPGKTNDQNLLWMGWEALIWGGHVLLWYLFCEYMGNEWNDIPISLPMNISFLTCLPSIAFYRNADPDSTWALRLPRLPRLQRIVWTWDDPRARRIKKSKSNELPTVWSARSHDQVYAVCHHRPSLFRRSDLNGPWYHGWFAASIWDSVMRLTGRKVRDHFGKLMQVLIIIVWDDFWDLYG